MSRRVRHCCAGRAHPNPEKGGQAVDQLKQCFRLWREALGIVPQKPAWMPWQPKSCCGDNKGSGGRARLCMGHNYCHCERCHICRVGDPRKALKKNRGNLHRLRWKDVIREAALHDNRLVEDCEGDAVHDGDGPCWVSAVKTDPQIHRKRVAVLKEFVVRCLEEQLVSDLSDDPIVVLQPQCPTNCSCRPRRVKRKVARIDRLRVYEAAGAPPPVENDWVVV